MVEGVSGESHCRWSMVDLSILRSRALVDVFSGWPRWWRDHARRDRSPESKRHCGASRGLTTFALRPAMDFFVMI